MKAVAILLAILFASPQEQTPPLPTLRALNQDIQQVIDTLATVGETMQDRTQPGEELKELAYTETETLVSLDAKGRPKETETNVYQVTQGVLPWQFYRRQISSNGVPKTAQELEKQDREQAKRSQRQREESERAWTKAMQAVQKTPLPVLTPEQRREQEERFATLFVDHYGQVYDIRVVRREMIDNRSAVLLTFRPKAGAKTKDGFLKMIQHISIDAWISEKEHQLAKMDVHVVDTISFGFGILAKFNKGSSMSIERKVVNGDVWAPVKVEGLLSARVLLVKGLNKRITSEYSDFKKYTVNATLQSVEAAP